MSSDLETRLNRLIEHHIAHGGMPSIDEAVADRPELAAPLLALAQQYLALSDALDDGPRAEGAERADTSESAPPSIAGFRVIERLGAGGMGVVYKLQDLKLDRVVAAKILRRDHYAGAGAHVSQVLREAKALALFSDPRIVQIFEFRADADPPVIIMEYVDGFELGRIGPSLEFRQQAKIVRDVCDAIGRAHALGIQHRDLKPSNIMLDGQLAPKILDFGLSAGDPRSGHFQGTLRYIAPEQLNPSQTIDARTDVYALGVILYELLTGTTLDGGPAGDDTTSIVAAIRHGHPRLPVEIRPLVPEALQAVALKAMEHDPAARYQSAREMQLDLERYLDGRAVTARPTQYASTLATRVRPHLDQIGEWLRLRLIYPHEAAKLQSAYRQLEAREDDWIVATRALSYSQIALYLGAFFLTAGSLFYFVANRFHGAVTGVVRPFFVLGLPFLGLNLAGRWLYRREHQAVAVAFYLGGIGLLPLFLLIYFNEARWWNVPAETPGQLFTDGSVSNFQLQLTIFIAALWAGWLAWRTKTSALSTVLAVLIGLFSLAILADYGLRDWLDQKQFDKLALHLWPLVVVYALAGLALDRQRRAWFARSFYVGAAVSLVAVVDLLALDGRLFQVLGVSLQSIQPANVKSKTLIDTLSALTVNGILFYLVATIVERRGTPLMAPASQLLFVIAPFSILEPLAYLSETQDYWARVDWLYLLLAVAIAVLSHNRQRKSFYYAGLVNTGLALMLIADRRDWFDKPAWAIALIAVGLCALVTGFLLDAAQRRRED